MDAFDTSIYDLTTTIQPIYRTTYNTFNTAPYQVLFFFSTELLGEPITILVLN
jgi:hypothetical protein